MQETSHEIGRVIEDEGIDAEFQRGGTITLARSPAQLSRLRDDVATAHARGFTEADERMLDAGEAAGMLAGDGVLGGSFTPHCATVTCAWCGGSRAWSRPPAQTSSSRPRAQHPPGRVETDVGTVRAEVVLRATEGYTPDWRVTPRGRAGHPRWWRPSRLDEATLASIGSAAPRGHRPTFSDGRHLIIYGQRTADGRLAFGGRGAPYHFGSRIRPSYDVEPRVEDLRGVLRDLLPQLGPGRRWVRFTHQWGGCLGITRDWAASVGLRPADRDRLGRRVRRRRSGHHEPRWSPSPTW